MRLHTSFWGSLQIWVGITSSTTKQNKTWILAPDFNRGFSHVIWPCVKWPLSGRRGKLLFQCYEDLRSRSMWKQEISAGYPDSIHEGQQTKNKDLYKYKAILLHNYLLHSFINHFTRNKGSMVTKVSYLSQFLHPSKFSLSNTFELLEKKQINTVGIPLCLLPSPSFLWSSQN